MAKESTKSNQNPCSQGKEDRDENGRFPKGVSGNPNGVGKSHWRVELENALREAGKDKDKTFLQQIAEWAYEDKTIAKAVLNKLIPDLRSIEGSVKHDAGKELKEFIDWLVSRNGDT